MITIKAIVKDVAIGQRNNGVTFCEQMGPLIGKEIELWPEIMSNGEGKDYQGYYEDWNFAPEWLEMKQ